MGNAIFTNGKNAYQVLNIYYAGSVSEIPKERRVNGNTHSFKIITGNGVEFFYFNNEEQAKKTRGALAAMLDEIKPNGFKHGWEFVDPSRIIAFSDVIQFKKPLGEFTHGFIIMIETADVKSQEIWLRYKSEEHAQKARKALWAALHNRINGSNIKKHNEAETVETLEVATTNSLPF
jgi:hypothetical protein